MLEGGLLTLFLELLGLLGLLLGLLDEEEVWADSCCRSIRVRCVTIRCRRLSSSSNSGSSNSSWPVYIKGYQGYWGGLLGLFGLLGSRTQVHPKTLNSPR